MFINWLVGCFFKSNKKIKKKLFFSIKLFLINCVLKMYLINLLAIFCLITTIHCLPLVDTISNIELDNELKNPVSVDQALNKLNKAQLEDTTPSNLFNNNEPEEEKMFKINDANELIDTTNLAPSSKQQSSGGIANVQSLIDQTNTISTNLENMIKEMVCFF